MTPPTVGRPAPGGSGAPPGCATLTGGRTPRSDGSAHHPSRVEPDLAPHPACTPSARPSVCPSRAESPPMSSPVPESPEGQSSAGHPHAGDPVFDLHVGGKMAVGATVPLAGATTSPGLHPGRGPVCEAIAADPADAALHVGPQHGRGRHRRHRRARARRHRPAAAMPVMEARRCCSSSSAASTRCPSASTPPTSRRSSRPWSSAWRRASAASTSRTSPRRGASRSRTGSRSS